MSGLTEFLIVLVIIGAALYLLQFLPIDGTVKRIIQVIVIVILVIWAIRMLLPMAGLLRTGIGERQISNGRLFARRL
jgi:hypothetical protein